MASARVSQEARRRAREARLWLDTDRQARDERIEAAVAEVFTAVAMRAEAEAAVAAATSAIGGALQRLLDERLSLDQVAGMTELAVGEVRRLAWSKAGPKQRGSGAS